MIQIISGDGWIFEEGKPLYKVHRKSYKARYSAFNIYLYASISFVPLSNLQVVERAPGGT